MIGAGFALALAFAPVLGAPSAQVAATARSELRYIDTPGVVALGASSSQTFESDNTGTLRYSLGFRRSKLTVSYLPRFIVSDLFGTPGTDLLNGGSFEFDYRGKRYKLTLFQGGSYGRRRFSSLAQAEVNRDTGMVVTQTVPGSASVLYASSVTQLTATYRLTRRSDLTFIADYSIGGGVNEESRQTVPFVYGPRGEVRWDVRVTRRDTVGTSLTGIRAHAKTTLIASEPANTGSLILNEHWTHAWGKHTTSDVSGGMAIIFEGKPRSTARPVGQGFATLTRTFPTAHRHAVVQFLLGGGAAVEVDRVSGQTQPVARATAQATWTEGRLRLYLNLGANKSLSENRVNAAELVFGELGTIYGFTRHFTFSTGVRLSDQSIFSPTTTATAGAQEGLGFAAFVALGFEPKPLSL